MLSCCFYVICVFFFFFKQKTAYEMRISDWSSDVCSSDLRRAAAGKRRRPAVQRAGKAGAEEGVDHQLALARLGFLQRQDSSPPASGGAGRIAFQSLA